MILEGLAAVLILMGVMLWLVDKYAPLNDWLKNALNSAVITAMLWLLYVFGIFRPPL